MKTVIETEFGIIISEQTARRRLHETGFKGRAARKKPYVDKSNRMKCIQYAKKYREQPLCFWDQVLWTDESKFNLFGSDGRIVVWRTPQQAFDPRCTVPTVEHGGGNVKCWGSFSSSCVGNLVFIDGNMTGEVYRDILQRNLFESVKKLNFGQNWVLHHDNDSKHRAHIVTKWLDEKGVEWIKWPSFSLDLNSVERIWDEVERRVRKEKAKNEFELKQALLKVWYNIANDVTKKLVDSVPNHLHEVIRMNGYPTTY